MSLESVIAPGRRLAILKTLEASNGYAANDSYLQSVLELYGFNDPRELVRCEMTWLERRELVTVESVNDGAYLVATLTTLGGDVAAGRLRFEGVKRPAPGRR